MKKKIMILCLVFFLCMGNTCFLVKADNTDYGADAYRYMRYLNDVYPDRVQNTQQVREAGFWIKSLLEAYGYTVEEHSYDEFGMKIVNYVVEKPGNSEKTVYIGAHYDCVAGETKGADDNASGVGVTLELAKRFYNTPTDVTLKFCFWDAEELDYACAGSCLYVGKMTQEEKDNCLVYMNLDCVGAGDNLYVYGGYYDNNHVLQDMWAMNMADSVSAKLGMPLKHMPEVITYYDTPTRPGSSDNVYFQANGMTYLYFEANAWQYADGTINEKTPWMLTSTNPAFKDLCGQIMHSANDNMDIIEAAMPGKIQSNLTNLSKILSQMIREFTVNSPQQYVQSVVVPEPPTTEPLTTEVPTREEFTTEESTTEESTAEESTTEESTTEESTTEESTAGEFTTEESVIESSRMESSEGEDVKGDSLKVSNLWLILVVAGVLTAFVAGAIVVLVVRKRK